MIKSILTALGYIVICSILLSLWGFYWLIKPIRIHSSVTPQQFNLKYESVEFRTEDNVLIRGWFIPNENPKAKAIILLHGYPADKGNILPGYVFLHQKYHLLFIDFRYLGESEGSYSTLGKNEVLDVLAATQFLQERGIKEVGIVGFSMGGAVALMAAEKTPNIKAVISESSYSSLDRMATEYFKIPVLHYPLGWLLRLWGLVFLNAEVSTVSPLNSAIQLKIPLLIMHSKADDVVSFEHAMLFKKALGDRPEVEFIFWDNLSHGEAHKGYQKEVSAFFDKNL
jgi:dipeptidyl aminopeptidase/acylaminoacyl peptidase